MQKASVWAVREAKALSGLASSLGASRRAASDPDFDRLREKLGIASIIPSTRRQRRALVFFCRFFLFFGLLLWQVAFVRTFLTAIMAANKQGKMVSYPVLVRHAEVG